MVSVDTDQQRTDAEYPIPRNEGERLVELYEYDVLDTPSEEEFDRLTSMAEQELDASVAAVTFIDEDRQFLKSAAGADGADTERDESFCTYTILSDQPTVIEDTRTDERFEENYAVVDGREVRCYAGAPLVTTNGNRLGSFCVFGFEPRAFTERDLNLLGLFRDQTMALLDSHHNKKKLRKLAHYDSVTGFPTREHFTDILDSMLERLEETGNELVLGHLDLTRFSRVSKTLGYEATDQVLETVAERLRDNLPASSIKTRVLGDEFLLAIPGVSSRAQVRHLANSLVSELREPIKIKEESFLFSARIGLAHFPDTATSSEDLLRQSNVALGKTSSEQSSSVKFYLDEMNSSVPSGKNLEQDFLSALRTNRLHLNYQPKVDLRDRSVAGMEALVRWDHPGRGFVSPRRIVSLAETLGVMSELGTWVMETACRKTCEWNRASSDQYRLGVNVSALEFQQGEEFVDSVRSILEETGLQGENLIVEITETEAMHDVGFTVELLKTLREIPVQVAIDDYGTGQSSLQYLAEFPSPILKIDRAFVDGVTQNSSQQAIVRNTLRMARELDITTIAEGVEQDAEEQFLNQYQCDYYQGYYFSKPLSAATFEERYVRSE